MMRLERSHLEQVLGALSYVLSIHSRVEGLGLIPQKPAQEAHLVIGQLFEVGPS